MTKNFPNMDEDPGSIPSTKKKKWKKVLLHHKAPVFMILSLKTESRVVHGGSCLEASYATRLAIYNWAPSQGIQAAYCNSAPGLETQPRGQ
jgi:hypothetical protein